MIEIEGITKVYGDYNAVDNVSRGAGCTSW